MDQDMFTRSDSIQCARQFYNVAAAGRAVCGPLEHNIGHSVLVEPKHPIAADDLVSPARVDFDSNSSNRFRVCLEGEVRMHDKRDSKNRDDSQNNGRGLHGFLHRVRQSPAIS
jgi:hypothetical protein